MTQSSTRVAYARSRLESHLRSLSKLQADMGTLVMDIVWVNYNELTTSSLEIIVSKGNHPQMALIQVSELL